MREGSGARSTFLLEVGCEEIPAPMIREALDDLSSRILEALGELGREAKQEPGYGGPRRLVALIRGIHPREDDREEVVHGPARAAAYDARGVPTKAAEGFARKHGIAIDRLEVAQTPRGEVLAARRSVPGRSAGDLLAAACPTVLGALRFRKMMRWGDQGHEFVRPVHWILALLDGVIVPFEFLGIRSGRTTRGHRFLGPGPHEIPHPDSYAQILGERGAIVVRHEERRRSLAGAAARAAAEAGGRLRPDEELLDELTFLTEHPQVISGRFPERFLELPDAVLMTAMRHHQKYLTVEDQSGRLLNAFVGALTTDPDPGGLIRRGNEWVLRARLADARFFYEEDQKTPLRDRAGALQGITFQARLGTYADKVRRLEALLADLAPALRLSRAEREAAMEAAGLCKTDLTTGMVGEFPELQGIVGGIYARLQGHPEACARAVEEHYRPAGASDPVPSPGAPAALALADKLDTLALCFVAGLVPRGSADPYALRRAALGLMRILIENRIRVNLDPLLKGALELAAPFAPVEMGGDGAAPARRRIPASGSPGDALREFLSQRLRYLMEEAGIRFDAARAALAAGWSDPLQAWRRAEALNRLRGHEDFLALAAAAKRVRKILAQAEEKGIRPRGEGAAESLFREPAEKHLHREILRAGAEATSLAERDDHVGALSAIASLRPAVDRFFDDVLVMDGEEAIRANRLALLSGLSRLLCREADFAEVVVESGVDGAAPG